MKKLFYHSYKPNLVNFAMLIMRLIFGFLMLAHGWKKLSNFAVIKEKFMSFMGMSPTISLGLATFAEFFCSILLIIGLFTRLATIPLLITIVVIFNVHGRQFWGEYELVPAFGAAYMAILLIGPGKYSCDALISRK
jgi:putative oxidoreductase